jgi:23S rRNA (guanine745-N1)-methyltransferase
MNTNLLKCPLCHQPLTFQSSWSCGTHNFDMAKEGYVNLCIPPIKGDDALLVQARSHFFVDNPYEPLMKTMMNWINPYSVVLDVGCGIGAYLHYFKNHDDSLTTLGCDGSKIAIKKAAKRDPLSQYIVANMNNLPVLSQRIDVVLSVFAPIDTEEVKRVLKPKGYLISVYPAPDHLLELKQLIYVQVKLNPLASPLSGELTCIHEENVSFSLKLNQASLLSLFQMTPYAYTSHEDALERIKSCDHLNVRASFILRVYQT